jgi:hypothetical protein
MRKEGKMSKQIKGSLDQVVEAIKLSIKKAAEEHPLSAGFDDEQWQHYSPYLRTALEQFVVEEGSHYFNAPDDDKSSMFCRCGKYITNPIHKQYTLTKGGSNGS